MSTAGPKLHLASTVEHMRNNIMSALRHNHSLWRLTRASGLQWQHEPSCMLHVPKSFASYSLQLASKHIFFFFQTVGGTPLAGVEYKQYWSSTEFNPSCLRPGGLPRFTRHVFCLLLRLVANRPGSFLHRHLSAVELALDPIHNSFTTDSCVQRRIGMKRWGGRGF